jgi:medium-chain acyl-[acyl-carrier-protein] hydrolase
MLSNQLRGAADGGEPRVRLVCFPHAGGSAASFNAWLRKLPPEIALERVELPGRNPSAGRPPYTDSRPLIEDIGPTLAAKMDRPFALYGHSLGALVAYELACYFRSRGLEAPLAMFVSGRRAPHCKLSIKPLFDLADDALIARLAEFGGTPSGLMSDPRWRNYLLPALRADLEMSDRYIYEPGDAFDFPIFAFRGHADSIASEEEVAAWRHQTRSRFSMTSLSGQHFFDAEASAGLIERIAACLLHDEESAHA